MILCSFYRALQARIFCIFIIYGWLSGDFLCLNLPSSRLLLFNTLLQDSDSTLSLSPVTQPPSQPPLLLEPTGPPTPVFNCIHDHKACHQELQSARAQISTLEEENRQLKERNNKLVDSVKFYRNLNKKLDALKGRVQTLMQASGIRE